mmetsp:Transcript_49669/g.108209  ORF Transcript_49669/g.108209 Transcript_49669/m.108209 type:complete len:207 (-) Transcript_49669:1329-1949(-)
MMQAVLFVAVEQVAVCAIATKPEQVLRGRSRWSGCVPSMVTSRLPRCPSRHLPAVRGAPRDRGPEHLRRCLRQLHPVMRRRPHRQRRRQLNPKPLQRRLLWSLKRKDQKESRDLPWRRLVQLSHQLVLLRHPILRHTLLRKVMLGRRLLLRRHLQKRLLRGNLCRKLQRHPNCWIHRASRLGHMAGHLRHLRSRNRKKKGSLAMRW